MLSRKGTRLAEGNVSHQWELISSSWYCQRLSPNLRCSVQPPLGCASALFGEPTTSSDVAPQCSNIELRHVGTRRCMLPSQKLRVLLLQHERSKQ